jgi:hypothetical protein
MNNDRVHDRAADDADALRIQIVVHHIQHRSTEIVLLQQVTKTQNRHSTASSWASFTVVLNWQAELKK